ncbi:MAG TPA: hypothetical protein VIL32_04495, partial [Steroidobacteraceae bacterium]
MARTASPAAEVRAPITSRLAHAASRALLSVLQAILILWASLAIYFSNLPWFAVRLALAIAFAALSVWALWFVRTRLARIAFALGFLVVLVWWLLIPPSHDRQWRPEAAVMPRAYISGDRVHITGVRDFDYRSVEDF